MKTFTDRLVVIPKNEDSDDTAALRISSNQERETITIAKHGWGSSQESIIIPRQFLQDVIEGLEDVKTFIDSDK